MEIIKISDERYPNRLRNIDNPPMQLYTIGNLELLNSNGIAIVGSRKCTNYGLKITEKFVSKLSEDYGICIISGMAKGIDTMAHMAALSSKGTTIAVLGSGFDYIYPQENIMLFDNIIKNKGLVITEYPPNTIVDTKKFPERNRIVSGISIGTLVVEAAYRSGTSITAAMTIKQGKPLFSIPNSLDSSLGIGTNRLIKNGAKLVSNVEDIMEEYPEIEKIEKIENIRENSLNVVKKKNSKKDRKNELIIKKEYLNVYKEIGKEPIETECIYRKNNGKVNDVNYILMMLEIEGYIIKLPGNKYKRI